VAVPGLDELLEETNNDDVIDVTTAEMLDGSDEDVVKVVDDDVVLPTELEDEFGWSSPTT